MTQDRGRVLRLVYSICLAAATLIMGGAFIAQILNIYTSGPDKPFTREIVTEHLTELLPVCLVWIASVIGGCVIWLICPPKTATLRYASPVKAYCRLRSRLPDNMGEEFKKQYKKLKTRTVLSVIFRVAAIVISAACAIVTAVYLIDVSNFPADPARINAEVIAAMARVLICTWISMSCFILLNIYEHFSAKRLLPTAKLLVAEAVKSDTAVNGKKQPKSHKKAIIAARISVLAVAVVLIVWGLMNGGAEDVLSKAIAICTECIGLG